MDRGLGGPPAVPSTTAPALQDPASAAVQLGCPGGSAPCLLLPRRARLRDAGWSWQLESLELRGARAPAR